MCFVQVRIARTSRRALRMWTNGSLLRTFQAWAGVCVRAGQGAALLSSVARACAEARLIAALREWAWVARWVVGFGLRDVFCLAFVSKAHEIQAFALQSEVARYCLLEKGMLARLACVLTGGCVSSAAMTCVS
jgi:hypothetical protein